MTRSTTDFTPSKGMAASGGLRVIFRGMSGSTGHGGRWRSSRAKGSNIPRCRSINGLEELTRGDLDAAILALPVGQPGIESERLIEDQFLIAVATGAERDWLNGKDPRLRMQQERLLLLEEGHCLREQALHYCQLAQVQVRQGLAATSLTTIIQMVAAGRGITLLPAICAQTEIDRRRVALIPFPEDAPSRTLGLAWRRSSARRSDYLALADLVRRSFPTAERDEADPGPGPSAGSGVPE